MIKICIPYYSEYEETQSGIRELEAAGFPFRVSYAQSALVAESRNAMVNNQRSQAIFQDVGTEYSHYLFIDSDIRFTLGDVLSSITHDQNILVLPYLRHGRPDQYVAGTLQDQGIIGARYSPKVKGLRSIDWSGAGFLLVKAHVFNRMRYPWFRFGQWEKDGRAGNVSEDIGFCMGAKAAGFKIWCDFDRPVYHLHVTQDHRLRRLYRYRHR